MFILNNFYFNYVLVLIKVKYIHILYQNNFKFKNLLYQPLYLYFL